MGPSTLVGYTIGINTFKLYFICFKFDETNITNILKACKGLPSNHKKLTICITI